MANPVPNNLALSVINTGDTAQSAPLRNNYAAIQTAVNEIIACLSGGTANQLLQAVDGTDVQWVNPPGYEIGYDQIATTVNVTGLSSAAPTTIISGSAHSFDGAPVIADFGADFAILPAAANGVLSVGLFEGATLIAILAVFENPAAGVCVMSARAAPLRFTPTAGSHTYSIKAWVNGTTGTPGINAGVGSGGANAPASLRFTKV